MLSRGVSFLPGPITDQSLFVMEQPIVIFDGVCNFCNSSVNFIMKRDPEEQFLFAPNQEESGQKLLHAHGKDASQVETLYLLENGKLYDKSTAALRISRRLRFPWNLCYGLIIIPAFLRNPIYDFIARHRYQWFGKREACRIPSPEERARFI